tara:strand:- start:236 stop:454 length:219 start_codon:yes stop_codon:yes gene_type:complete
MKITKKQLIRIIKEEKARLLSEQAQDPIGMLEELNMNLQDMMANVRGPMYDDLNEQLILLEKAIRVLKQGAM